MLSWQSLRERNKTITQVNIQHVAYVQYADQGLNMSLVITVGVTDKMKASEVFDIYDELMRLSILKDTVAALLNNGGLHASIEDDVPREIAERYAPLIAKDIQAKMQEIREELTAKYSITFER